MEIDSNYTLESSPSYIYSKKGNNKTSFKQGGYSIYFTQNEIVNHNIF